MTRNPLLEYACRQVLPSVASLLRLGEPVVLVCKPARDASGCVMVTANIDGHRPVALGCWYAAEVVDAATELDWEVRSCRRAQ